MNYTAIITGGIGGIEAGAAFVGLIWFFRSFLGAYLTQKAKNLATKEDIEILTRLQEEVKAEFNQLLERQRMEAQL